MALKLHPPVFILILMTFQLLQNFTFKVTLITCVFDAIMVGPVVLLCLALTFRSEVTHAARDYLVAMKTVDVHCQAPRAAQFSLTFFAGK